MRALEIGERLLVAGLGRRAKEDRRRLPLDPRDASDLQAPLAEGRLDRGIVW